MWKYSILFSLKVVILWWQGWADERFQMVFQTLPVHMSSQCDLLVDAVADFAFVLAVILESDVLDFQVGTDYLIVLPANRNANKYN